MDNPFASIVISVYNSGKTLERCMESLICQTLPDIEIIVVDKDSTDNSPEIERFYSEQYPDRVKVYARPYSDNAAAGRTYGIQMATADYVAFCDADDYLDVTAFEKLHDYIEQSRKEYDLICYGTYLLRDGVITSRDLYKLPLKKDDLLMGDHCMGFWNKLVKRELLLKCGEIFDSMLDDLGYIPIVISAAKNIGCLNQPLYFFEQEGGASHREYDRRCLQLLGSLSNSFERIDAADLGSFAVCAASRVIASIDQHPVFKNEFIGWLRTNRAYFASNSVLKTRRTLYQRTMDYIGVSEDDPELLPLTLYVNGFGGGEESAAHLGELFLESDGAVIIVLDENSCDVHESPLTEAAFRQGRFDFLGQYFALKAIYASGGFFIGREVNVLHSLVPLQKNTVVLSQLGLNRFSGNFFASLPGHIILRELLNTYTSTFYEDPFLELGARLDNIIACLYGVSADGLSHLFAGIFLSPISLTTVDVGTNLTLCTQAIPCGEGEGILVSSDILAILSLDGAKTVTGSGDLRDKLNAANGELAEIKNSDSYHMMLRLKRFANSRVGRPFKRIFKFFMRIVRGRKS